jgi:ABC-type multidrug transport system permease subunit
MTNQEIVAVKPLILVLVILFVYLIAMLYQYREIAKNVGRFFKGGVIALLVTLGIIEDK